MGKSDKTNAIVSFLAGTAVGAVAGILFAPDKGSETRSKIKEKAQDVTSDVSDSVDGKIDGLRSSLTHFISEIKGRLGVLEKQVEEKAEAAKSDSSEA